MRTITINLAAGQNLKLDLIGNYFHLLDTTAPVDVEFLRNGGVFATAQAMEFGFFSKPAGGFEALGFVSAVAQTIKIAVGLGDGGYNRTTGAVTVLNQPPLHGPFTQANVAIGSGASTVVAAANPNRRYLLVVNPSTTANAFVQLDGAAANLVTGIKLVPGGSIELQQYVPTGAIQCISDQIAASVIVVEG